VREGPRHASTYTAFVSRLKPALVAAVGTALVAAAAAARPFPGDAMSTALENGSFTTTVGGHRMHYEVHGSGPVLMVLTNSWGLSLQALRAMYRPLEERLTLVYFDPRGMGGSEPAREDADRGAAAVREDFLALREHLKVGRVNAIGWSNGAINLLFVAADHPEALASAIFVHGMPSFGPEDMAPFQREHPELVERYGAFLQRVNAPGLSAAQQTALQREFWLGDYLPYLCADREKGRALVARVFADAQLSWPHSARTNAEIGVFDLRDRLAGIRVRSLVIAGAHDLAPPSAVKRLADGLPDARFVVFEKSGHFSPVEEAERFRETVFGFLGVSGTVAPRAQGR
jgi:proline iminopeptidase